MNRHDALAEAFRIVWSEHAAADPQEGAVWLASELRELLPDLDAIAFSGGDRRLAVDADGYLRVE